MRELGRVRVKERVFGVCVLVALVLPGIAPASAQTAPAPQGMLPVSGFVSSYEIMRTIREAGFEPLAPPLREGTDYVLRATDFRGILMRVVVDARTAAIRDVTRIVPGPGRYGQFYAERAYGPPDLDDPIGAPMSVPMGAPVGAGFEVPPMRPPAAHLALSPTVTPLPRPRPAALASRKPDDAAPAAKTVSVPAAKTANTDKTETNGGTAAGARPEAAAKPEAAPPAKSQINSEVITAAPPPASAGPKKAPVAVEPLND
jgi:hypothetical protein